MKKNIVLFLFTIVFYTAVFSKNNNTNSHIAPSHRTCSTIMPNLEWENDFQQRIQLYLNQQQNNASNRELANYTIPVVVHVIYWDASQNISQAQVNSQITILNNDYAGTGLNAGTVPAAFAARKANTNISFCLAAKKPNGTNLTELGIDRINAQTAGFSNPNNSSGWSKTYIDNTIKPATIWDPTKYMNIWVLYITDGLLGYATFPSNTGLPDLSGTGSSTNDGVVIGHYYFGNTGTATAPYDKGRTATHEIGHWLGLRHISGDSQCGTDYCADTPPQVGNASPPDVSGLNYGCPTYPHQPNSCSGTGSNGELFMDFMDYTDDPCMYMFTTDQRTRMQTAMANGTYRASLVNSNVCTSTPQAPVADFTAAPRTICPGNTVQFTDASSNTPTSWSWSFTGGTPSTSTSQNPLITYSSAGTFAVTLTATNGLGSDGETKTAFITVANPTLTPLPVIQDFQSTTFPPTGWSLTSLSGFNWERSTAAGGFGTSTASIMFDNSTNDAGYKKDDFISPVVNLNVSNPKVKFDVAYAPYVDFSGTFPDTIEVLIKNFCSGVTTSIYRKGGTTLATAPATGNPFVPTSAQWRKDSVSIPSNFLNNNIQVIFRNYGDYGNKVYIDNINIYGTSVTGSPTASFTASDTTVCAGNNLTFTNTSTSGNATAVDSVRWTIPGGIPSTSTSLTNVISTFNTPGTYIISLKAYEGGIGSTVFTKSVRVKALPVVSASTGASSVCVGSTTTFTNTTAGGVWSSSATGIATVNSSGVVAGIAGGTCEIIYTVTISGCSTSAVKLITVNALPTVAVITGSTSVCVGANTTLSCVTSGGVWSSNATSVATVNTNGIVNGMSAGNATISYTITANGCSKAVTTSVTVKPLPATPTITQRNDTLTCSTVGGVSYNWYRNDVLLAPSTTIPKLKISQSGTYTVEVIGTNQCTSVRSAGFSASLTGIKNNKTDIQYSIVPNPNFGLFEIRITSVSNKIYQLKLFNVNGQTIFSEEMNVKTGQNSRLLNIKGIEKGVYFLSLIGDDGISTQNVLIQ